MRTRSLGDLAQPARLVDPTAPVDEVAALFREDEHLCGVVVACPGEPLRIVDRVVVETVLGGFDHDVRADRERRPIDDFAVAPLLVPHDADLLDASRLIQAHTEPVWPEHLVVTGPGDQVAIVPVSRVLAELARLYEHQARHDALTGLPNRTLVLERITAALSRARRHGTAVGALFVDLDRFKAVNDTFGHAVGDHVLVTTAERLRAAARTEDVVGRLGGDEFVVIAEVARPADLAALGARLVQTAQQPMDVAGTTVTVDASVGVAVGSADTDADDLLRRADHSMYAAKQAGGARLGDVADEDVPGLQSLRMDDSLRRAISAGRLELRYQPIIELTSGRIVRVEALARWKHEGRTIAPDRFVAVAERSGLIEDLGGWARRTALAARVRWRSRLGDRAPALSINVSPHELEDLDLPGRVADELDACDVTPGEVTLELTESVLAGRHGHAFDVLDALRELGVGLAIDDFGVGTSTLARVARLPMTQLKIDRSFVSRLVDDPAEQTVVRMILAMGRDLGLDTVAEGVERPEQADMLRGLGCPHGQGYLWSPPVSAAALERLLIADLDRRTVSDVG